MKPDELRVLAEAATPGPWAHYRNELRPGYSVINEVQAPGQPPIIPWAGFDATGDRTEPERAANARFIAAANPRTVLALLDEREMLLETLTRATRALALASTPDQGETI